jgi:hypothetical protein
MRVTAREKQGADTPPAKGFQTGFSFARNAKSGFAVLDDAFDAGTGFDLIKMGVKKCSGIEPVVNKKDRMRLRHGGVARARYE